MNPRPIADGDGAGAHAADIDAPDPLARLFRRRIESRRIRESLLYSDVRGFTAFAERSTPEDVIAFLNTVLGRQVEIIRRHGGDVDKMIGDAILARFSGTERIRNAIDAAKEILADLAADASLPCTVGIGVHDGEVIAGTIGAPDRQDYTVIGDAVNVAARLCAAARAGELVVDEPAVTAAGADLARDMTSAGTVAMRGRRQPVTMMTWRARDRGSGAGAAQPAHKE